MMDGYTFHPRMIKKVAKSIVMVSNTTLLVMAVPILLVVAFFSSNAKNEEKNDDYLPTFVIKSDPSTTPTNTPIGSEDECESTSGSFEGEYQLIHIK